MKTIIKTIMWPPRSELSFRRAHKAAVEGNVPLDRLAIQQTHLGTLLNGARDAGNRVEDVQWGKQAERLKTAEEQGRKGFADATQRYTYDTKHRSERTPPGECSYIGRTVYVFIMLILWSGELPLNSIVLRVLNLPEIFNWIIAAALGLGLLTCAHLIGKRLKSYVRTPVDNRAICVLLVIVGIILVAMALVREIYMRDKTQADSVVTAGLIAIQCLIFMGALIAEYAHEIPASRNRLTSSRESYISSWVSRRKLWRACFWDVRRVCNAVDRVKDEFVASILRKSADKSIAPVMFYIIDFDDEEILPTPGSLRQLDQELANETVGEVK